MSKSYFSSLPKVHYEGPKSANPLAFKFFNPDEDIDGKKLKDVLRFAVSWWHTIMAREFKTAV